MAGIQNNIIFSQGEKLQESNSRDISEMQNASTDVSRINHAGDPEGVVSANPSSLCHDPVSGNVYVKQSGTGNTGWSLIASASSNGLVIIKSATVDMTNATAQFLFSNTNTFVVTQVVEFGTDIDTKTDPGAYHIGWTATAYDDFLEGNDILVSTNTSYAISSFQDPLGNPSGVIPASTDVYININTPATAITDTQIFYFIGYYLF